MKVSVDAVLYAASLKPYAVFYDTFNKKVEEHARSRSPAMLRVLWEVSSRCRPLQAPAGRLRRPDKAQSMAVVLQYQL